MVKNKQNKTMPLSRSVFKICAILSGIIFLSACTALLDSAIRDKVNASHSYDVDYRGEGLLMDEETGHFKVFAKIMSGDNKPANIPIDPIEYAFIEFCKISENYSYFNRIVNASQKGLKLKGYSCIYLIKNNKSYMIQLSYHEKIKQMWVDINTSGALNMETYAMDLSKVNVEIK